MVIGPLSLAALLVATWAIVGALRRRGRTFGMLAWRTAQVTSGVFLLAVLLYQKPQSFYTNFAVLPSLFAFLGGVLFVFVTVVLSAIALVKRDDGRRALVAVGTAVFGAVAALLVIVWRAR